jgi:predicted dehydrogenase
VTLDLAQAAGVVKVIEEKKLITAAAYMNRYRQGVREAKKYFADDPAVLALGGWIGGCPPAEGTTHWFFDKKRSGGQLLEQTTHTVDLVRFFCGEAVEVGAFGTQAFNQGIPGYDTDDASVACVKFANGAVATLMSALASNASGGVFLTVHAKNVTAKFDGWNHDLTLLAAGQEPKQIAGEANIFEIECRAFVDAVKSGDPSTIMSSYPDGVKSAQISIAANKAMDSGSVEKL